MPYLISNNAEGCSGWAVIKEDGEVIACHGTKQEAIDQAVAISLAEGEEFKGERSVGEGTYGLISDIDGTLITGGDRNERVWAFIQHEGGRLYIITGRPESQRATTERQLARLEITYAQLIMNDGSTADSPSFKLEAAKRLLENHSVDYAIDDNAEARRNYASLGIKALAPSQVDTEEEESPDDEARQVDLSPPAYFRASARRGLEWYEQGHGGDGLVERTIREARSMANGTITADKWVRLRAWIARHLVDMEAAANPGDDNYPTPGQVAMALWGGGSTGRTARRALEYADGVVARLEQENAGRARGEALSKMETRVNVSDFEIRDDADGGMTFEGYAAVFDSPSQPLPFIERIAPGAFRTSLKQRNNIFLLWNHDAGSVLASTRAKTLQLTEDDRGLKVTAQLPNTSLGRDVAELLRSQVIDSMSFGFTVVKDTWNAEGDERTLKQVRLHEVSIVAMPAYEGTAGTTSVRGLDKAAQRAEVSVDELADAILKIEAGEDLSDEQSELLKHVIDSLSPATDPEPEAPADDQAKALLALKKKKLELLMKGI